MDANVSARDEQGLSDGTIDLLAVHIAEGLSTDPESAQELDLLDAHGLLTAHTALIHSVGLSAAQIARVYRAGAAIVWSPHSNFELYGATANVGAAFREGVTIALAPDWAPTGSDNMLDEIKYAAGVNRDKLDGLFSNRQLVEMASTIPARIARLDDRLGALAPGMLADFFLLHTKRNGPEENPYDKLVQSSVMDVDLVVINGVPIYGDPDLLQKVAAKTEPISICAATRALNSEAMPNGPFATVTARLKEKMHAAGAELGPLAECVR
jgi:5-methylthioadenosine/S-adenosylhomocysteine deaminase